jgi:hypothetical protein
MERRHIGSMTNYMIRPGESGIGFDISITSDDGAQQTVLGFKTMAEADAWIADDKRQTALSDDASRPDLPPAREA